MSKKTGSKSSTNEPPVRRVCHVSYSLNNDQPVRSTIIGDQPLFYMDFEEPFEDELADFNLSGENPAFGSDRFSPFTLDDESDNAAEKICGQFHDDMAFATQTGAPASFRDAADIDRIARELEGSRFAAAMMSSARETGIVFRHCDQEDVATYNRETGEVLINPHLPYEEQVLLLGRELRRVWQHRNGVLVHPLTFHPDQAILVNRAQVSDLTIAMIRIAWELQLGGYRDAWSRIEESPMSDLARVFAREAFLDFRTLNNGLAMASTFEMWFLSERCRSYDKALIQQMLSDYQGYVFDAGDCSRALTNQLMCALGEVPFGKNYLAPYAATIIADPVFSDVRDRANANFLWFIKFEKSFRETEQELQKGSGLCDRVNPRGPSSNQKDPDHDPSPNVVRFPCENPGPESRRTAEARGASAGAARSGAEVIVFPFSGGKE
ncbi:MAG: hypothetical protein EOM26_10410 [Alphaproteobacteria bacterium]|nr:hypothetical protein [Alphaproteobacteria bacterium]